MMWWYGDGDVGAWGYVLMTISMVLFWGFVIYGVVMLLRYVGREDRPSSRRSTPEELLAERFARGEIDQQEYRERMESLREHRRPVAPR